MTMKITEGVGKLWKPVAKIWNTGDITKRASVVLGLSAMALAPVGALGVYASELVQDDKANLDLNSIKGRLLKWAALIYPIVWSGLQAIATIQAVLAGSITSIIDGILLTLSNFYYDHLMYDRLETKLTMKRLESQGFDADKGVSGGLKQHLEKTNNLLNFYTNAIFVGLLSWYGEFTALPDLSPDVNPEEPHRVKPLESQDKLLNKSKFWERIKFNFAQEIKATKQAFSRVFSPNKWKGTLLMKNQKVEDVIREHGLKWPNAWLTRIGSSSLASAFACISAVGRLTAGLLFLAVLPKLGLQAFSDNKTPEDKKEELRKHPVAQRAFDLANLLKSMVLWSSGLMSIVMGFSLAYKNFAGGMASKLQAGAGLLSIVAGANQGATGRLMTFLSSIGLTFANGLRNLVGGGK
jgi:hypothetical protein